MGAEVSGGERHFITEGEETVLENVAFGSKVVRDGERENLADRVSMTGFFDMLTLPRFQIIGGAWCDWLSCGCWWQAGSACGWMGRQTSRPDSSVVSRP